MRWALAMTEKVICVAGTSGRTEASTTLTRRPRWRRRRAVRQGARRRGQDLKVRPGPGRAVGRGSSGRSLMGSRGAPASYLDQASPLPYLGGHDQAAPVAHNDRVRTTHVATVPHRGYAWAEDTAPSLWSRPKGPEAVRRRWPPGGICGPSLAGNAARSERRRAPNLPELRSRVGAHANAPGFELLRLGRT